MNKTTISIPKILISLIVYFALPLSAAWLNQFVDSMTITHTMTLRQRPLADRRI